MSNSRPSPRKTTTAKKSSGGQAKKTKKAKKTAAQAKAKAPKNKAAANKAAAPAAKTPKPAAKPPVETKAKAKPAIKASAGEKSLRAELADLDAQIGSAFDLTERVRLKGLRADLQRRLEGLAPDYAGPQVTPAHRRTEAA